MKQTNLLILTIFYVILLVACATPSTLRSLNSSTLLPFEQAVRALANDLLYQVQVERGGIGLLGKLTESKVVLDPFVDAKSGDVVNASRRIEEIILEEGYNNFQNISLSRLTPDKLREADYVMSGVINFDLSKPSDLTKAEKYYRVSSSMFSRKTGKILANSNLWISEKELDYLPIPSYKDSPVYLKDSRVESLITTTETPVGKSAHTDYYESLSTTALLVQADTAYEDKNYKKASRLYNLATKREDGQIMKTYAGSYEANLKLGNTGTAKQMFRKLLETSVKENRKLNLKFLFSVNRIEFLEDYALRKQYDNWLREISLFLQDHHYCFQIVGHSSRTGDVEYNHTLSIERAKKVQTLMQAYFPQVMQKSRAVGKGFEQNMVGSGTDDLRDAIDRRVEFFIVDCSQL